MNRITIALLALGAGACTQEPVIGAPPTNPDPPNPPLAVNPVQLDRIVQVAQPQVDVLFVIDNSCSMAEEQALMSTNFPTFMSYFQTSGLDYHIGVTTTDTNNTTEAGRLRRATVGGQVYRFIDEETPNPVAVFSSMILAGTGGWFDETGRAAAYQVLETRRTAPRNEGFYRDDAALHIIYISDEEDYSVQPSRQEFRNWTRNLKAEEDMVTHHAITGLPNQLCGAVWETGNEYIIYTNWNEGILFSICQTNWQPMLDELGLQTSGLKREYFLSKIPVIDPWSLNVRVEVDVNGQTVTRRFTSCLAAEETEDCDVIYNPGRNSISFLEYVPEPFSEIFVEYNIRELFSSGGSAG